MTNSGITRRRILRSAATGGLAAAAASRRVGAARAQSARKTFVFVSGAFCGGWIWRRVADRLEQGGHKVFAPSLTGLGERSHLLSKDVDLDTHIADVVNLIKWESLENVCLVSWSYAGFVGSGALESIGNRVSSIVWLDAYIPADGQRVTDFAVEAVRKGIQTATDKGEAGVRGSAKISASCCCRTRSGIRRSQSHSASGRHLSPADQAFRSAPKGGEEDIHPPPKISTAALRQGTGRLQERQVLGHVRTAGRWAHGHARCTGPRERVDTASRVRSTPSSVTCILVKTRTARQCAHVRVGSN